MLELDPEFLIDDEEFCLPDPGLLIIEFLDGRNESVIELFGVLLPLFELVDLLVQEVDALLHYRTLFRPVVVVRGHSCVVKFEIIMKIAISNLHHSRSEVFAVFAMLPEYPEASLHCPHVLLYQRFVARGLGEVGVVDMVAVVGRVGMRVMI